MLKNKLSEGFILAPGIYDALTGLIAAKAGAEAVIFQALALPTPVLVVLILVLSQYLRCMILSPQLPTV